MSVCVSVCVIMCVGGIICVCACVSVYLSQLSFPKQKLKDNNQKLTLRCNIVKAQLHFDMGRSQPGLAERASGTHRVCVCVCVCV